jgi:hypothetical protein
MGMYSVQSGGNLDLLITGDTSELLSIVMDCKIKLNFQKHINLL